MPFYIYKKSFLQFSMEAAKNGNFAKSFDKRQLAGFCVLLPSHGLYIYTSGYKVLIIWFLYHSNIYESRRSSFMGQWRHFDRIKLCFQGPTDTCFWYPAISRPDKERGGFGPCPEWGYMETLDVIWTSLDVMPAHESSSRICLSCERSLLGVFWSSWDETATVQITLSSHRFALRHWIEFAATICKPLKIVILD